MDLGNAGTTRPPYLEASISWTTVISCSHHELMGGGSVGYTSLETTQTHMDALLGLSEREQQLPFRPSNLMQSKWKGPWAVLPALAHAW